MPHISKENILELSSMSNEVKAYLEKLYPECFKGMSELLKSENSNVYNSHDETTLEKAKRLYKEGCVFKSLLGENKLIFRREPVFKRKIDGSMIYDYETGFVVFKDNNWAEIICP